MKILLATGVYPPRIGGPARQVYDLANALAASGEGVAVLTFSDKSGIETQGDIKVYYVKDNFLIFKLLRRYFGIKKMLKKISEEFKPEIVQSNSVRFLAHVVGSYAKKNKIPSITKYAGDFVYEKINSAFLKVPDIENVFGVDFKARLLTLLEKRILKKFNFIWAQSQYQKRILEQYLKIKPDKIVVMPNYINIFQKNPETSDTEKGEKKIESKKKIILSASRFVPWKNIEAQVFIAKKLKEITEKSFFLYLVGGGDKSILERVRRLIRENNLINEVKILPQVSPLEVHKNFEQAHVYLSTSLYEPFGVVFVEAMSAGLPIVALGSSSVPEIVKDSQVGFVVKRGPNYVEHLAERLKIVLENDDVYSCFSANALAEAQQYDLETNIAKFTDLYNKMTNVK